MLEMLLTSSALIAVILLVRRLFRSRLSLRLRYALWLLAAVRLLVPGSLFTAPVSIAGSAAPVAERLEEYRYEPQRSTVYVSVSAGEARAAAEGTLSREDLTDLAGGRGLVVAAAPAGSGLFAATYHSTRLLLYSSCGAGVLSSAASSERCSRRTLSTKRDISLA